MKSASDPRTPPRLRLPLQTWDPLKGVVNTNGDALLLEKHILLILSPFSKLAPFLQPTVGQGGATTSKLGKYDAPSY